VNVDHLITSFGYWAVFCLVALESVGVPLPGETSLIAAGIYAGHSHKLSIWVIFLVAAAAAIIGDNIGYWVGDKGGYQLLRRYGHYVRIDESKMKIGRYIFDRHGGKVVFFGRFVSILRTYAAFLAGTNKMRWRTFFIFNAAGGIVWAAIYAFGAYILGNSLRTISGTVNLVLLGVAVVVMAFAIMVIRRQAKRLAAVAEAAYPGPLRE
jgi:membrane protein DedA with SNARE-associated domain